MQEISINQFKKETHHKPMKYIHYKKNGEQKEFTTNKFYFNRCYLCNIFSMPKFNLGIEGKMYKNEDKYIWVSEYGRTEFKVLEK